MVLTCIWVQKKSHQFSGKTRWDCCKLAHLCFLLVKKFLLLTAIFYAKDHLCLVLCYPSQSAKKVSFTACHLDKLKLAFTSPNVISTSPKHVLMVRIDLTIPSSKNFSGPSGKLRTKFTSQNAIGHDFLCTLLHNFSCQCKFYPSARHLLRLQ